MTEPAILEALDLMLEMQSTTLLAVAELSVIIGTRKSAEAMDEAEAHRLWVKRWRERYIPSTTSHEARIERLDPTR